MTQTPRIPDPETRKQEVRKLKETSRQLDQFILLLDEAIALVEVNLRNQRRVRLETRTNLVD